MSVTASTPPRRRGSVRRTVTHDCTRLEGLNGPVTVLGRGRDLLTPDHGGTQVLDTAQLDVQADFATATITSIVVEPTHSNLATLIGAGAFSGFRARVNQAMPAESDSGSLRYQLLDDLPTAIMLSGRALRVAGLGLDMKKSSGGLPVDICAGWVADGTLLNGLTDNGPPLTLGPVASSVKSDDDSLGWHEIGPLAAYGTRRHRRLDVWQDDRAVLVDGFFRDSFADAQGVETVVHEYTVRGAVDPETSRFLSSAAEAGPLPYPECPRALASAQRVEGLAVGELRNVVRTGFVGPGTCTHLNDTLRSLQDISALLRLLHRE
ncbi:hypothetical protein FHT40_006186 [Mycolicibacterium sp. BK556]|uniref:DUF2889 domain-containing protein n=1 Tax=unclassified Mycolicibacterium TaxID=2636767 RepID=UPI0016219DD4|nr:MULTISPECIES: DUF2889 domain-containing protein [unclassified Mycolicibacterium]MBB3606495.1 hypothetical protein [Mycolicibacterium sp. BK556]MBB3636259.1 hypothetical protein [Mycolicibacterium sp. BK607]